MPPEVLLHSLQLEKQDKAATTERNGLKEKLERLQKANKQRRGELEEMQAKLSSMHQRASAYDQARLLSSSRYNSTLPRSLVAREQHLSPWASNTNMKCIK